MRTQSICLALAIVLLCSCASGQWVRTNGLDSSTVTALAVSGTNLFAGTGGSPPLEGDNGNGVYLSTNNGISWTAVNEGLPRYTSDTKQYAGITCFASSGTNLFTGTGQGVFCSTNSGTSWTAASTGLTNTYVYALAVSDTNLFAGTGRGVFLSTNNGISWTPVSEGLPRNWSDTSQYAPINRLALSGQNLFAGSFSVFLSTNNGTNWTPVNTGLTNTYVHSLGASGTNLFVGMHSQEYPFIDAGLYLSTNNGTSWTRAGLTKHDVLCLAVSGVNLFAGTDAGVFLSTNNGTDWTAVNEGLARASWDSLNYGVTFCLGTCGTNLFASIGDPDSGHCSIWWRPLSEMITDVKSTGLLPTSFVLHQNYPNPFNPSTTIKYKLCKSSMVRLSVYDLLGREASLLVNERRDGGVHEVKFDGTGLSSGVYFYRLQAGDFVATKRLLLLK